MKEDKRVGKKEMYDALSERVKESYESRDKSGKFKTFIKEDEVTIPIWKCGQSEHIIDVLPYVIGDNSPSPKVKKGDYGYVLIVWTHDRIGVNEESIICPNRNYSDKCPICEEQKRLKDEGYEWDSPEIKALEPKKKTLYNIICYDNDEEVAKGVQLWVTSHWNFERIVTELAKATPRSGGSYVAFADPDEGKSIAFKREGKKATDTKYLGHKFVDRDYVISQEDLESAQCLENLLDIREYEDIQETFLCTRVEKIGEHKEDKKQADETTQRGGVSRLRRRETTQDKAPEPGVDECPAGGVFGDDNDKLDQCNGCPNWDNCYDDFQAKAKAKIKRGRINR